MSTRAKLVDLIERDRISSTMACDVMGKTGWLPGIMPLNSGFHVVGEIKYVFTHSGTNYHLHEQVADIEEDKIIFVDAIDCGQRAVFGDIVSNYLLQHRRARAIVTNGYIRDADVLIKENYPVWCIGATPIGCHKVQEPVGDDVARLVNERKRQFEGSLFICDDSGVSQITEEWLSDHFKQRIDFIEAQEEVWHYCVNTLKWSTYDTVCLQKYLETPGVIPKLMFDRLMRFSQKN
jgi:regulator of RNase E activity RraA